MGLYRLDVCAEVRWLRSARRRVLMQARGDLHALSADRPSEDGAERDGRVHVHTLVAAECCATQALCADMVDRLDRERPCCAARSLLWPARS